MYTLLTQGVVFGARPLRDTITVLAYLFMFGEEEEAYGVCK